MYGGWGTSAPYIALVHFLDLTPIGPFSFDLTRHLFKFTRGVSHWIRGDESWLAEQNVYPKFVY